MSTAALFIDRDGTLIEEPPDEQVDTLQKVRFLPGVFASLQELEAHGFKLVMVTNQDGLGTTRYPQAAFDEVQEFLMNAFSSQDIFFDAVFVCPHQPDEGCTCRKPKTGLVDDYIRKYSVDLAQSAVIGDRTTDLEFAANLKVRGLTVQSGWPQVLQSLTARRAELARETRETRVAVRVNLDAPEPRSITTGIGFFDHMLAQLAQHGGFSLELGCRGDLEIDEHHTVEDCALTLGETLRKALGTKVGIARYGFNVPMDEARAEVLIDLSGRPFAVFSGHFARDAVGAFPTELVPHFFRSLGEGLRAGIHVTVKGDNTHHMIEACFKALGRALRQAVKREGHTVPSTKGIV